ncbi:hypothetical protein DEU56DRAFT_97240 [Suillus clintonianus]|uniref:uncharacterized protein n=1 Tax=Suillus clintonianus TaxID=1904413 RepID=UPI001B885982|nr:uncharacterized protein DEU56DRAFT_97240 [Suillus clintonianus]KAG2121317.1 hypothetical protein DEU56DRAFT_97240 [Suillus clintonianus]
MSYYVQVQRRMSKQDTDKSHKILFQSLLHFTLKMQTVNPVVATILHLLRTAATLCMGIVFLYLARREPEIKFYAFYAGTYAIVMGALGLITSRRVYRKALAKKNEATKSQSSADTAPETTGTEGVWEDEKLQEVPKTADLLV